MMRRRENTRRGKRKRRGEGKVLGLLMKSLSEENDMMIRTDTVELDHDLHRMTAAFLRKFLEGINGNRRKRARK